MAPQPETVLLACEHKFHCIVGGDTFSETLVAIIKAHGDSQCPCNLGVCDRAWVSPPSVSMDETVDMYEPPMVWFGSAWDMEPKGKGMQCCTVL